MCVSVCVYEHATCECVSAAQCFKCTPSDEFLSLRTRLGAFDRCDMYSALFFPFYTSNFGLQSMGPCNGCRCCVCWPMPLLRQLSSRHEKHIQFAFHVLRSIQTCAVSIVCVCVCMSIQEGPATDANLPTNRMKYAVQSAPSTSMPVGRDKNRSTQIIYRFKIECEADLRDGGIFHFSTDVKLHFRYCDRNECKSTRADTH